MTRLPHGLRAAQVSATIFNLPGVSLHHNRPSHAHTVTSPCVTVQELDSREQLEALQGLIERIAFDTQLPSHKGGPAQKSTQSLLAELQSAAAQY